MLGFCLGIGALQWQPTLPAWGALLAGLVALMSLTVVLRWQCGPLDGAIKPFRVIAFHAASIVLAIALGFSWAAWRAELRLADELPIEWERRDISVVGVIAELPREFEHGRRFVFAVEQVETPQAKVPERILLSWFAGAHEDQWLADRALLPGERWRFTVRLKRPHGNANPGGFDYEAWLLERGLRATGYVRAAPAPARLGEVWTLPTAIERARAVLRQDLQKNLGNATSATFGGVIVALALGDQGSIDSEHWRIFAATGTTHLMSISGLHVTMMAALFGGLVNFFWRRQPRAMLYVPAQRTAVISGWLAALAYTLLAGVGIPALRTLLMLSVAALAHTLDRRVSAGRVLLLALWVVQLFDPWAVLVIGFWLSFAAVAALLFFVGDDYADRDQHAAVPPEQQSRLRAGLQVLKQWGWAQWVVTLGTVPLVLAMFQAFSLVSPLANALAIPLVGFVIAPLSVAAALLPLPWLASLAHLLLDGLMLPLDWLAAQPWALWRQAEPAGWTVLLATAGVLLHLLIQRLAWRLAALAMLLPLFLVPAPRPPAGEAWIDMLDVGQGLAVLVRTAERNLLFDTGPRYSPDADAGQRLVLPALRSLGVRRIDGLVISHQDNDHAGGTASVRAEIPVGWMASSLADEHPLRWADATPQYRCHSGLQFEWDGVRFRFLSPPRGYYDVQGMVTNRLSCVLKIEAAGRVALLTGDSEITEEKAMLAAGEIGPLDVLQVAHHGSRSASGQAFATATSPKLALFPVGYRNPFLHPHPEVLERFRAQGGQPFRTDIDGAIHVEMGAGLTVAARRQSLPRYWHGR